MLKTRWLFRLVRTMRRQSCRNRDTHTRAYKRRKRRVYRRQNAVSGDQTDGRYTEGNKIRVAPKSPQDKSVDNFEHMSNPLCVGLTTDFRVFKFKSNLPLMWKRSLLVILAKERNVNIVDALVTR